MCVPAPGLPCRLPSAMSAIGWRIERAATSLTAKGCESEEVEFMTSATVYLVFEVDARREEAGQQLAVVEHWPESAPHFIAVTVSPPGGLDPTSSGALEIKRLGRNTFRMAVWEPPVRSEWVG